MDKLNNDINNSFSVLEYVSENYIKIILLLFTFFIIYVVEKISRYNSLIYGSSSVIPGMFGVMQTATAPIIRLKNKKIKK